MSWSKCVRFSFIQVLLTVCSLPAVACGSGALQFSDKMQKPSRSWNFVQPNSKVYSSDDKGTTFTLPAGKSLTALTQFGLFQDVELCFDATLPASGNQAYVAAVFWATDTNNLYLFDVFPASKHVIGYRVQNNKSTTPSPSVDAAQIKAGEINHFDLIIKGGHADLSINGAPASDVDGMPPNGGGLVGFEFGASVDGEPTRVTVSNFEVRSLP
jgi:hypothetical protein